MEFLYLFDLIDFDENGIVCEGSHGISQSQSNFLYLLSKYNQVILKEENLPIPDFFKSELFSVLEAVCEGNFGASKKKVLENCKNFTCENCECVILIKPQFEANREDISKGGVVKDKKVHQKIIEDIKNFCENLNFEVLGVIESPITGAKHGNIEYLIYLRRGGK